MHRVFMPLALTLVLATSACAGPDSAEQSALAGGAVGAGVGVVGTAVTGGCIWCGAAIGGAVGATGGLIYDQVRRGDY
jgi:hypothetical protein